MARQKFVIVEPAFSLNGLDEFLDREILKYRNQIEVALSQYGFIDKLPKEVLVTAMNSHLKAKSSLQPISLDKVFEAYGEKSSFLAEVPFLLGLVVHQNFLRHIQDIQSIEAFENKPEGLFKGMLGRPSQLCLRRIGQEYIVGVSTYVHKGLINAQASVSANSIKVISFLESNNSDEKELLKNKMIG